MKESLKMEMQANLDVDNLIQFGVNLCIYIYISKFIHKLTCFYLWARPITKQDFCKRISTKGCSPSQVSFPMFFHMFFG